MNCNLKIVESNIPELNGIRSVKLQDSVLSFDSDSPIKRKTIKFSCVSSVTELDSDKYLTTAKFNFPENLFIEFKADTEFYLKIIKHNSYKSGGNVSVEEGFKPGFTLTAAIFGFALIVGVSDGGNNQNTTSSSESRKEVTSAQKNTAQLLIQNSGYRCDSVSFMLQQSWNGSYRVTCNDDNYAYLIEDIGGNWIVKVD